MFGPSALLVTTVFVLATRHPYGTALAMNPVWLREPVSPVPCYSDVNITLPWVYEYTDNPIIGISIYHGNIIFFEEEGQIDMELMEYQDFVGYILDDDKAAIKITNCEQFPYGIESEKIMVELSFVDGTMLAQTVGVSVFMNYTKLDQNVAVQINGRDIGTHNIASTSEIQVPPGISFPVSVELQYDDYNVFKPRISFHGEDTVLRQYECRDSPDSGQCELILGKDEAGEGEIYIAINQYEVDSDSGLKIMPFLPASSTEDSLRPDVSVTPTKGPQAGGTNITLAGLADIKAVFLYNAPINKECSIVIREAGVVIAQTPSHNKSESLQIRIQLVDGSWIEGPMFEYKANPTIKDIRPLVSLTGGSTRLTISGNSLDSVAEPKIKYGVENCAKATKTDEFIKVCEVETADQMICLTPDLRQCTPHAKSEQDGTGIQKRDVRTPDQQTDNSEVQFYLEILGFILDGDDSYTDLPSTNISNLGELRVYGQPMMYRSKEIIKYNKGVPLQIKGQDLRRGNSKEDFIVHVGAEICHVTVVVDSSLQCVPPDPVPLKAENSTSKYHLIIVHLGNYINEYGELQYPDPLLLPLAVGVPLFVLVVIAITTAALLIHHRNKQNKKHMHQQEQQRELGGQDNDIIELPPIQCDWDDQESTNEAGTSDG